jgi:penicillin-binding protein 1C
VEVRTFVDLPPRYAAWASAEGLARLPAAFASVPGAGGTDAVPALEAGWEASLTVVSPEPGARLRPDPEAPAGLATVALEAVVDPPVPQVVWYVDGEPFRVVDYPYGARWPLRPGEHYLQVRVPHTDLVSRTVRVRVE